MFSSTQPSLRARVIPRFPANVLAGNGMVITKVGITYTFEVNAEIAFSKLSLPFLINAANDSAASAAGVAIGELYRNGSVVMVRVA